MRSNRCLTSHVRLHAPHAITLKLPCCRAGLMLLYTGASLLVARLSSEVTKIGYERHMLFTDRFSEYGPMRSLLLPITHCLGNRPACGCLPPNAMSTNVPCSILSEAKDAVLVHVLLSIQSHTGEGDHQ